MQFATGTTVKDIQGTLGFAGHVALKNSEAIRLVRQQGKRVRTAQLEL